MPKPQRRVGKPVKVKYWPPHPFELMEEMRKPRRYRPSAAEIKAALAVMDDYGWGVAVNYAPFFRRALRAALIAADAQRSSRRGNG